MRSAVVDQLIVELIVYVCRPGSHVAVLDAGPGQPTTRAGE